MAVRRNTDRMAGSFEVPASWVQLINPLVIVVWGLAVSRPSPDIGQKPLRHERHHEAGHRQWWRWAWVLPGYGHGGKTWPIAVLKVVGNGHPLAICSLIHTARGAARSARVGLSTASTRAAKSVSLSRRRGDAGERCRQSSRRP